jgi:hypothetical protein
MLGTVALQERQNQQSLPRADGNIGRLDWCVQNLVNIRRPIELLLDLRNDVP